MYERNLKYEKFIFDGKDCKDKFGIIRCKFDSDDNTISGGDIETSTYSSRNTNEWKIISNRYSSPLSFSISFCKCDGSFFDFYEMKNISRWLVREDGYRLMQFYDGTHISSEICYECKATKNIIWKMVGENCVGGTVNFICKHPYARTSDIIQTFTVNTQNSYTFVCNSDATYVNPFEITILVKNNCTVGFTITSSIHEANATQIRNCVAGETIKIDCVNKIITTDKATHDIANDFNYVFQKITCGGGNEVNSFTGVGNYTITIKYYEARKVVI